MFRRWTAKVSTWRKWLQQKQAERKALALIKARESAHLRDDAGLKRPEAETASHQLRRMQEDRH